MFKRTHTFQSKYISTDSFQDGIPVGSLQGLLVSQHLLNAHCVLKEVRSISGLKKLTGRKGK